MDSYISLVLVAILVESIIEWIKDIVRKEVQWMDLASLGISFVVLYILGPDIPPIIGFNIEIPVLGIIFLSIIISRGANYVHEVLDRVNNWRKTLNL